MLFRSGPVGLHGLDDAGEAGLAGDLEAGAAVGGAAVVDELDPDDAVGDGPERGAQKALAGSTMQFTSFACCTFSHTIFTGSDMVQNNFNGVQAFQSSFDDSDLYNSRFIGAHLVDTSLLGCGGVVIVAKNLAMEGVLRASSGAAYETDTSKIGRASCRERV